MNKSLFSTTKTIIYTCVFNILFLGSSFFTNTFAAENVLNYPGYELIKLLDGTIKIKALLPNANKNAGSGELLPSTIVNSQGVSGTYIPSSAMAYFDNGLIYIHVIPQPIVNNIIPNAPPSSSYSLISTSPINASWPSGITQVDIALFGVEIPAS